MTELISVTVNDGKYTIQQTASGRWEALRYGEHWPAMASGPGNLAIALAYEVDRLRASIAYWQRGTDLINECLRKAARADHGDAPFPLDEKEAKAWHNAQMEAFRHALEMMGVPEETPVLAAPPSDPRKPPTPKPAGTFMWALHLMLWESKQAYREAEPHVVYDFDGAEGCAFWLMNSETDDLEKHAFTCEQIIATDWKVK